MLKELSAPLAEQLTDYQAWRRQAKGDFDLIDYTGSVMTPDIYFATEELICPTLIVHDEIYFLKSHFDPAIYAQWKKKLSDTIEIQRIMNHLHICTLFQQAEMSDELAVELASRIAGLWSMFFLPLGLIGESLGTNFEDASITLVTKAGERKEQSRLPGTRV